MSNLAKPCDPQRGGGTSGVSDRNENLIPGVPAQPVIKNILQGILLKAVTGGDRAFLLEVDISSIKIMVQLKFQLRCWQDGKWQDRKPRVGKAARSVF